ncbi:MAG TPA: sulfite exporter TauE/SafE family protein [Methylomirabilota bacterium]|nr:sulfite exporter TauE/SafE family protein [Methylomirabilota bacterium]
MLAGLVIGAFGTLIGAGGGFLVVPILLLGYHFPPADAVGTSLAVVFLNALSGAIAYLRQGRVDLSLGWRFAAATLPGAVGGAYLTRTLTSYAFSLGFGLALIVIAALLFTGRTARPSSRATVRQVVDVTGEPHVYHVDAWKGILVSLLVGLFSSLLGIGGGIIHVPFLIVALGLPVHVATATSHFVLSISALVGALTFWSLGHVRIVTAGVMGLGVLLGAQVGARASLRASAAVIRRLLAGSLALVGARMVLHAVRLAHWGLR